MNVLITYIVTVIVSVGLSCIYVPHFIHNNVVTTDLRLTELEQHTDVLARQIVQMKADNEANDKYVYDVIKGIKR